MQQTREMKTKVRFLSPDSDFLMLGNIFVPLNIWKEVAKEQFPEQPQ